MNLQSIIQILIGADGDDFQELAKLVGLDPSEDFEGLDFAEANLDGQDLSGFNLAHCNFRRAQLRRARLCEAKLNEADLTDADLRGTDLNGADLRGANFTGADLTDVNWGGADRAGAVGILIRQPEFERQETKDVTLEELWATRNDMLRLENMDAAKAAGAETSKAYSDTLFAIQDAIRDLENAELLKLLQQLRSNESALREGIRDLKQARNNIGHVETFLKATAKVLQIVGKVTRGVDPSLENRTRL